MVNNYLRIPSSLADNSCSTLFIQPYFEAKNNFTFCFGKVEGEESVSLAGRVTHFVAAIFLFVPILNTITLLFLRLFSYESEAPVDLISPKKLTDKEKEKFIKDFINGSLDSSLGRKDAISSDLAVPIVPKSFIGGDKEFIENFVEGFVWPYIQKKITAENEPSPRVAMIDLLHRELAKSHRNSLPKAEVEEIAFQKYLYWAVLGLYIHLERTADIQLESGEFAMLVNALTVAIPKDFPEKILSPEQLRRVIGFALLETNQKREESRQQARNHPSLTGGIPFQG